MMSGLCMSQNCNEIKRAIKKKKLFSNSVKDSTLLMVFEILWNIGKQKLKCKEYFSKKTLRGLKKYKSLIKYILSKNKNLEKKKSKFLAGSKSFKKVITRLLVEFYKNCTEKEIVEDE